MKKKFIKTMSLIIALTSVVVTVPTMAKAADVNTNTQISRNIPSYPFHEFGLNDDLSGAIKITKDNLSNPAKKLYNENPEEGEIVVKIINHANFFAETRYKVDGQVRGNRDGYKAAYVGAALQLYVEGKADIWIDALYDKNNSLEEQIDNYNAYWAKVFYSREKNYNYKSESTVEIFVNWMLDYYHVKTSTGNSKPGENRILSSKQEEIAKKNPQFAEAAYNDYAKAYSLGRGISFNDAYDAVNRAIYGGLLYLDAKQYNASKEDVRAWLEGQFAYEGYKPSKIQYSYIENAMNEYDRAAYLDLSTEKQIQTLAFNMVNNHELINVDKENNFSVIKAPVIIK